MPDDRFESQFRKLTGHDPFPWQATLYQRLADPSRNIPKRCDIPTGLGKTAIIAVWLLARQVNHALPRRLIYVVNRRTVVDQTTGEVEKIRRQLPEIGLQEDALAISTLRGQFADNRQWSADPSRLAVICGTVDMIGSRLLFNGYGVGYKGRPLHAGFLGQDSLIVHDEAHLEPAFQCLLETLQHEQTQSRCRDILPLHVMELTATTRGKPSGQPPQRDDEILKATEELEATQASPGARGVAAARLQAVKKLHLIEQADAKKVGGQLARLALEKFKDSGQAILIFVREITEVKEATDELRKAKQPVQQLIGPMRGLERERLLETDVFKRFLPPDDQQGEIDRTPQVGRETVFLVCTSAGEVGVNISADHLACDLSTLESMAQRFGRVNRFGLRDDSEIHVVHPTRFDDKQPDPQRAKTLALLRRLHGHASPASLADLPEADRQDAFAPLPNIPKATDILLDAWAMTSIRGAMPGRPPVGPYLHGISDYEPAETHVAWREEVGVVTGDQLERYKPEDLLEKYPLLPHELLRDISSRVFKELEKLAKHHPAPESLPVWIVDAFGQVDPTHTLAALVQDKKKGLALIEGKTILLPHKAGGLTDEGMLDGACLVNDGQSLDVADASPNPGRVRMRLWNDGNDPNFSQAEGMREILRIDQPVKPDDEDAVPVAWHWFEQPIPNENTDRHTNPVLLDDHVDDVVQRVRSILGRLSLDAETAQAIDVAARLHDLGKRRDRWQDSIGRPLDATGQWYAKSGKGWRYRSSIGYRHEFGSLLDLEHAPEFSALPDDCKDLVRHIVASHHGQARPHFTADQAMNPRNPRNLHSDADATSPGHGDHPVSDASTLACEDAAAQVGRRYARLQRRYGRWGLAYLESILRAADWAASAEPSKTCERQPLPASQEAAS